MSYLEFHLLFLLPPLLALTALRPWRGVGPGAWRYLPLLSAIALLYTTPWDNYLVWRGVWGYGPERVLGVIGYVPVEEYLFFLLQPLLTGLWLYLLLGRTGMVRAAPGGSRLRFTGTALHLLLGGIGIYALAHPGGTYLGLILAWAAPVLAGQWAYAGHRIAANARVVVPGIALPTLYLWVADAVAIRQGIWEISERYTLGPAVLGLPLEEAVFFLVTNVLVVQGLLLFLAPPRLTAGGAFGSAPLATDADPADTNR